MFTATRNAVTELIQARFRISAPIFPPHAQVTFGVGISLPAKETATSEHSTRPD